MKLFVAVLAFVAFGAGVADASTISVAGEVGVGSLLAMLQSKMITAVPEPGTWGLMIAGFVLIAHRVRVLRKVAA